MNEQMKDDELTEEAWKPKIKKALGISMILFIGFSTTVQILLCFAEAMKPNLLGHFPLYLKTVFLIL